MSADLQGKTAIVTGASRGIGRNIAEALIGAGASVLITASRNYQQLEDTAGEIGAESLLADVSHETDAALSLETALEHFGHVDILINNAARGMIELDADYYDNPRPFWELDPELWRSLVDINVNGPFLLARSVVPHMLERGWGRIVNVSISEQTMRRRGQSPYGPSKAALDAMSAVWAQDLAGSGVSVNTLVPGGNVSGAMLPDYGVTQRLPADVMGPAIVHLASEASDGKNGERILASDWHKRTTTP